MSEEESRKEGGSIKRGRGRPRKYPVGESPAEKRERDRANGIRRGRGRPRKNPSDRVEKPATGSSGEQKVDKAGLIADISNSTGGDAQTPNPDVKPKRGRGRPPKYKKEAPAEQEKEKKTPSTTEQDKAPSTQEDSTPSTKPKTATSDEDSNESGSPPPESLSVVVEKSNGDTTSDAKQE